MKRVLGLVLVLLASFLMTTPSAAAATSITINGGGSGRVFDGVGAVSGGGGNTKLLYDYAEPQRSQILDYLFKPGYGAALSLLKVEIGGDANSTDGAEPSHMHTATDQNYNRGYEWWLMEQAKARNPNIKLAALAWAAPGWIGTSDVWTQNMITYLIDYLRGARDVHGLTIDYLGGWNENGWNTTWFVNLRNALNANGFSNVKLVGADNGWDVVTDMQNNSAFNNAISVVGAHYPCNGVSESTGDQCSSTAA
ncbi:MAG TPA: galactosylceramidase, partial [Amycolatopsis sp.]|nr:galactosylceramidase [Amycolatopsis sp.]